MSRLISSLRDVLPATVVAMATTWIALFAWRGFTSQAGTFLVPLLMLAALVGVLGALGRALHLPVVVTWLGQMLIGGLATISIASGEDGFRAALADAYKSADQYAPPIPLAAPPIDPLLIVCGFGCLMAVDLLACSLRHVSLAGLPLLTVYTIPVSITGQGVSWWVFVATAAGFVTMLFVQESEVLGRWGRGVGEDPTGPDGQRSGFSVRTGNIKTAAASIGSVATIAALTLPVLVPTLGLTPFSGGFGAGRGDDIEIENPMTDLRRDLDPNRPDIPLLTVVTSDPDPAYLRVSVLAQLNAENFSPGDRQIPQEQVAQGLMPEPAGASGDIPRTSFDYQVRVTDQFESIWLPTAQNISQINALGDWRYDLKTMDFLRGDEDLTTAGMSYSFTKTQLELSGRALSKAPSATGRLDQVFTQLPGDFSSRVRDLAREVAGDQPTKFQRAIALQNWFREDGGFTYNLTPTGDGDLMSFLGEGGREGYCEQFATSMAIMARSLGIPSRVAVGFLNPDRVGSTTFSFSSRDMHAWPELYFAGAGWVRFEPTPSAREGTEVPPYTTEELPVAPEPTATTPTSQASPDLPSRSSAPSNRLDDSAAADTGDDSAFPWRLVGSVGGGLLLVGLLLVAPGAARRVRRTRRWRTLGGSAVAWDELRDTATDLGLRWRPGLSPRATRDWLVGFLGPAHGSTLERPRRGPTQDPDAVDALDRIVDAVEHDRYARRASARTTADLRADVETCVAALTAGATRSARTAARWWPRSLWRRRNSVGPALPQQTAGRRGVVVDRVG